MVNLNGHETGNGGYSQGEPKVTTPLLYSAGSEFSRCEPVPFIYPTKNEKRKTKNGEQSHFLESIPIFF